MTLRVSTTQTPNWTREAANAINQTIGRVDADEARLTTAETTLATAVLKDGAVIYAGDTAGGSYDQTQLQTLMDAVAAISARLEG